MSEKDIVAEAQLVDGWAILAMPPSYGMPQTATFDGAKRVDELLRALADEVERLRKQIKDLDHDFDALVKEADASEETMMRKLYHR